MVNAQYGVIAQGLGSSEHYTPGTGNPTATGALWDSYFGIV